MRGERGVAEPRAGDGDELRREARRLQRQSRRKWPGFVAVAVIAGTVIASSATGAWEGIFPTVLGIIGVIALVPLNWLAVSETNGLCVTEERGGDAEQAGEEARLSGWVHRTRDHGNLLFIDLRDHYGITQCVADVSSDIFPQLEALTSETVVTFTGKVDRRSEETINPGIPTGEVELRIETVEVQGPAEPLPMPVNQDAGYPEDIRLRYRFLDLRREELHRNIVLRSQVISSIRRRMTDQGFTEFQTPILTSSSTEGARDFLVPSRLHPGQFYALPQAPQQFKQLIMVAGFDRYFQIAPCFRDEDARADRSPGEFYQLDIEMSFVTQDDVFNAIEPVLGGVFEEFADFADGAPRSVTPAPFPRIPYDEAMQKYCSDKPDLRIPIEIADVTDVFRNILSNLP